MDLELEGKSVIVTGAASGIGFATAQAFAKEGARVALFDWDAETLAKAEETIRATGAEVISRKVDVASSADVEACGDDRPARAYARARAAWAGAKDSSRARREFRWRIAV